MEFTARDIEDARKRLRRVEGQVGGIIRMLEDDRDWRDLIQQISAASKALERVGFKLIAAQLRACLADEEKAREAGSTPEDLERIFMSLS